MPKFLSFDLSGMDAFKKAIARKERDLVQGVDDELTASALDINKEQKRRVPRGVTGRLAAGIGFDVKTPLVKSNFSEVEYGPYMEFGTGGLVDVPPGLEDIAVQFKGKGVRKVNIAPRPFFFGPFFEQKPKLISNLEKLLSK